MFIWTLRWLSCTFGAGSIFARPAHLVLAVSLLVSPRLVRLGWTGSLTCWSCLRLFALSVLFLFVLVVAAVVVPLVAAVLLIGTGRLEAWN